MANVVSYIPFNMDDESTQTGYITSQTASLIRVDNTSDTALSTLRQDYVGQGFTYSSGGQLTGGTLTGLNEFQRASAGAQFQQTLAVSSLNVPVVDAFTHLSSGSVFDLYNFLFSGNDNFTGSSGDDVINAFGGNDVVSAGAGNDIVRGGDGNDWLDGGAGNDSLFGGNGDDVLVGGGGSNVLDGGAGSDTAMFSLARSAYQAEKISGSWVFSSTDGSTSLSAVEHAQFSDGQVLNLWRGAGPDFNGDARDDILWQNANGQVAMWMLDGTSISGLGQVGWEVPSDWAIKGKGDFNGDGRADILWQNDNGQAAMWMLNGTSITSLGQVGWEVPASWKIKGVGDFNADGHDDILWQNDNGQAALWMLNGTSITSLGQVGWEVPSSWTIKEVGDFNGDGRDDIAWQNDSGQVAEWHLDGAAISGLGQVGWEVPPEWSLV